MMTINDVEVEDYAGDKEDGSLTKERTWLWWPDSGERNVYFVPHGSPPMGGLSEKPWNKTLGRSAWAEDVQAPSNTLNVEADKLCNNTFKLAVKG